MAVREFDGELDAAPVVREFDGVLDGEQAPKRGLLDTVKQGISGAWDSAKSAWGAGLNAKAPAGATDATFSAGVPEITDPRAVVAPGSVMDGYVPEGKPLIEARGAPVTADTFQSVKSVFDAASPQQRDSMTGKSPGLRNDGTQKGYGFLGELKRPDGNVSTELSIGVNIGGEETEIPVLVPTLSKTEIDLLLAGGKISEAIVRKAADHAKKRMSEGKSVFATPEDMVNAHDGWAGNVSRAVAKSYAQSDKGTLDSATAKAIDPRIEARTGRLIQEGAGRDTATRMAKDAMKVGALPGQEDTGYADVSKFDFDLAQEYKNANPVVRGAVKGYEGYRQGVLGVLQAGSDIVGATGASSAFEKGATESSDAIAAIGEGKGGARMFEGAVTSIAQQLPLLMAGAVTGSEALVLGGMAAQSFGQEYSTGRSRGLDGADAAKRASLFAAFEVIGEKFGLGNTLKALRMAGKGASTNDLMEVMVKGMAKEVPGEVLTTSGQFVTDKNKEFGLNKEAGWEEYINQVADTIGQTVIQTGMMIGGTTAANAGIRQMNGGQEGIEQRRAAGVADAAKQSALNAWATRGLTSGKSIPVNAPNAPSNAPSQRAADAVAAADSAFAPLIAEDPVFNDVEELPPVHRLPSGTALVGGDPVNLISDAIIEARRAKATGSEKVAIAEEMQRRGLSVPVAPTVQAAPTPPAKDVSGEKIDKEWTAFADDSGTLGIPRSEMPQIKSEHRGAMVNFMNARGVQHQQEEVPADSLIPTQAEFSPEKVRKAIGFDGNNRSILVSSDNYILDGHHQWLAKRELGESINVLRLDAPIRQLIALAHEFPSSMKAESTPAGASKPNQGALNGQEKTPEEVLKPDDAVTAEKNRIAEVVARLQNRNRSSAASAAQMAKIASNPDPDLLMASPTMSDGAPVASDLSGAGVVPEAQQGKTANVSTAKRKIPVRYAVVEASSISASNHADGSRDETYATDPGKLVAINNGRTAGVLEAYRRGTAGQYRAAIESGQDTHGIPKDVIAGMKSPVLVRMIAPADVTENIGDESNAGMTLGLSATEQAKNDASRLDMSGIEYDEDGHPLPQSVRMFITAMPESEQQTLAPNGEPTKQAIDRLTAATFHAAYENSELVGLMAEATDPDAVNILRAMSKAAASMAKLKDAGDLDIRGVVVGAAMKVVNAARSGVSMKRFLAQGDMFDNSAEKRLADLFAKNARSTKKTAEILVDIADFAYAESIRDTADMFGDSVPRASREDVLKRAQSDTTSAEDLGQQGGRRPDDGNGRPIQDDAGNAGDSGQNQDAEAQYGEAGEGIQAGREGDGAKRVAQPANKYDVDDLLSSYSKQDLEEKEARIKAVEQETAKLEAELDRKAKEDALLNRKTGVAKNPKAVQDDIFSGNLSLFSRAMKYGTEARTLDLFTSQLPARPGEDTAASRADRLGLASTTLLRGAKGSLLGLAISSDWIAGRGSGLIGKRVTSAADLATLGAVLRDPRTETFRYFLMKGDQVVYHTAVSSRMESSSAAFVGRPESFILGLSDTMERLGADGYYLMHNHPSRLVEASTADLRSTANIADMLPGFRGHVILDHTEFGLIAADKFGMLSDKGAQPLKVKGQDPTRATKLPHAALDTVISSDKDLANLSSTLRSRKNVVLVSADAQNHVTGIMEVAADDMKQGTLTARKNMMRLRKATGSEKMFAVLPEGMAITDLSRAITTRGLLLDAMAVEVRMGANGPLKFGVSAAAKGMISGRAPLGRDRTGVVDSPRRPYGTGDLFADMQAAEREEIAAAQRKNSPQMDMFAAMDRASKDLPAAEKPQSEPVPSDNAKSDASLDRSKARSEVRFETPYVGKDGVSLVGYVWPNKKEEYIDKRGEDRVRVVSDWEAAVQNLETGRQIVHQFAVRKQDGTGQDVSAETAAVLLGVSESTVRGNAKKLLEKEISRAKNHAKELAYADKVDDIQAQESPALAVDNRAMTYSDKAPMVERMAKAGKVWKEITDRIERESAASEKYRFLKKGGKFIWSPDLASEGSELFKRGWRNVELTAREIWPAAKQPDSKGKIEDVGEKLEFARKFRTASMSKDYSDTEFANLPFSKIWPADEIDDIEDTFIAAVSTAARAEVPAKPRVKYKVNAWVNKIKMLRQVVQGVMNTDENRDKLRDGLKGRSGLRDFYSKVVLLESIDRAQWKRIGYAHERPDAYRFGDASEKIPTPMVSVEIDGKGHWIENAGNIAEALDRINELLGVEAKAKKMEFEVRGRGDSFFINKKGDSEYRKLKTFTNSKDALAYRKDNYDDLVAAWEDVKDRDNVKKTDVRSAENRPRTGKDWRNGKDVGADEFKEAFGFRAAAFGNWVEQGGNAKERQGMLNQAYDALMDLSSILGIPPRAISLNSTLAIGFGLDGKGWAAAHYAPDKLFINLTKTKGAGTIAHEWFHALDNYFARMRNNGEAVPFTGNQKNYRENNYVTYKPEAMYVHKTRQGTPQTRADLQRWHERAPASQYWNPANWEMDKSHPEGVRPQVEKRLVDLVDALNASPMLARAKKIDKGADGYWSRIIERAARSFENYVISKMMEGGYQNDYLANVVTIENFSRDKGRFPYLLPEEVAPIAEAFDGLFNTLETKETDKGIALFSRTNEGAEQPQESTISIRDLKAVRTRVSAANKNMPTVHVLADPSTAPQKLRDQIEKVGAWNDVEGATYDGEIYLFANNLASEERAEFVLAQHELTHYGLRGKLGMGLDAALQTVWMNNAAVRKAASELRAKNQLSSNLEAVEEILADMPSADLVKLKGWRKITAKVRDWFADHGFTKIAEKLDGWLKAGMSDQAKADLYAADLVRSAREWVRSGKGPAVGQGAPLSRSGNDALANGDETINIESVPSPLGTDDDITATERIFLSSFPAGTRTYRHTTGTARAARAASESAGRQIDLDERATRTVSSPLGPFTGYETRAKTVIGLSGKEELFIQVFGKEQLEAGLDNAPALSMTVDENGEFAIYGPPSNSFIYKQFAKRGWAEPAVDANGDPIEMIGGSFWTKLTGATRTQTIGLMGDAHARTLAWLEKDHTGLHWKRTTGATGTTIGREGAAFFSRRSAITNQPINQAWQDPDNLGKWDDFVRTMQDKLVDTKRVIAEVQKAGIAVADTTDPYLQEVLYHGRAAKRVSDFAKKELRPLLIEMGKLKIERQALEDYLWARHAAERNAQIAKINPSMPDAGSGLTDQQAADILAGQLVTVGGRDIQLDAGQMPGFQSLAAKVDAITKRTTDILVQYGLETQETVDSWRATYGNYVPLMRDMESDDNYSGAFGLGLGTGQGFSVRGSASKRAMGSERGVIDILANVAMQRERAIVRGEKNRVAQAMYGLAITAPNPDFWLTINPDAKKTPAQVTAELVNLGLNPIDAANIANEPKQQYIDPKTGMVMERVSPQLRTRGDVLAVRIAGKDRYVMFSSAERAQRMVAGLKNLDAEQLGMVMQKVAVVTRWFAAINTQYNPVFGLTNGLRDLGTGMLNLTSTELKGRQAEVLKNAFSALRGVYSDLRAQRSGRAPTSTWALEFEEFAQEGGQTGYRDMFQTSAARTEGLMKELKDATLGKTAFSFSEDRNPLLGWLSDYNTAIENAVRLSAYKAGKDKGLSKAQAASLAKNLTVNFNKKGLAATQLGALYAFFNAAAQGTARIGQTMVKMDNGKTSMTAAGKRILYGGMMAGVLQAVMFAVAGYDDEEPPQFVREKNFIIPLPGGKYLSVPYPLGFHVIPNIGRVATEFALGGFKNPGKRMVDMFSMILDGFNPIGGSSGGVTQMLSPTITDPLVALSENKDWTGKSIFKEDFNKMHPTAGWTRKKDTSSDLSRWMSYGINYITGGGRYEIGLLSPTPDQLDYLIGQATGGVGRESLKAWQAGSTAFSGETLPMYKIPVAGRFIGETTGQASETSRFYNNLKRIGAHKAALDEMENERDLPAIAKYRKDNPDAMYVALADRAARDISDLKKRKRELLEKDAPAEKIKEIDARITKTVKYYNEKLSVRPREK